MRRSLLIAALVAVATMLVPTGFVFGQDAKATGSPAPIVVHMAKFAFQPAELTIHAGDTVAFVNDDDVAHTVTAKDNSFDSGAISPHGQWTHTFTQAGVFAFVCSYHPGMTGRITVASAN